MPSTFLPGLGKKQVRVSGPSPSPSPVTAPSGMGNLSRKEIVLLEQSVASAVRGRRSRMSSMDFRRAVSEAYERVVTAYSCVELYAMHASRLPIIGLEEQAELPGRSLAPPALASRRVDLPVLRVLNGLANPIENARVFRWRLTQQVLLSRRGAFVEVTRNLGGEYIGLRLLPPSRTTIVPAADGLSIDHYLVESSHHMVKATPIPGNRVRWIRLPHPESDFLSMTPLEVAGMSIEVDYFARLYARNFMQNDGRPGGILGIKGRFPSNEAARIEASFDGGADKAGRTVVLNVDDMAYTDTAQNPRETGYTETRSAAKDEILEAFRCYKSMIYDASGSTFDNSGQEETNWWMGPQSSHCDLLDGAFKEDAGDGAKVAHDFTGVEAVQRGLRARKAELRLDLAAGGISYDEYRTKIGEVPFGTPATRALWIPGSNQPIPRDDTDAASIGKLKQALAGPAPAAPPQLGPGNQPPQLAAAANLADGSQDGQDSSTDTTSGGSTGDTGSGTDWTDQATLAAAAAAKDSPRVLEGKVVTVGGEASDDLGAALVALTTTRIRTVSERLVSARARADTPYWTPPGTKDLPWDWILQPERWRSEALKLCDQIAGPEAAAGAKDVASALDLETKATAPAGQTPQPQQHQGLAILIGTTAAATIVSAAIDAQTEHIRDAIKSAVSTAGAPLEAGVRALGEMFGDGQKSKLRSIAAHATGAARMGAADKAAEILNGVLGHFIEREWETKHDDRVRDSHKAANGQRRPIGGTFDVGAASLRYPGDPEGPLDETIGCRCRLTYRLRRT